MWPRTGPAWTCWPRGGSGWASAPGTPRASGTAGPGRPYDLPMERYVIRGGREGYERLRVLATARRASTLELFQLPGL